MNLWRRVRSLSLRQLFQLAGLLLRNPRYIVPTLTATQRTFIICNTLYGQAHHKSNPANAFRHALWNWLICRNVQKITKKESKSIFWAQKLTDLYEKVTQNEDMDEAMDLHNNRLGRNWFSTKLFKNEAEIVAFLQKQAKMAKKIESIGQIPQFSENLVFISN